MENAPALGLLVPASRRGWNGRTGARAGAPCGPLVEAEVLDRELVGKRFVPGEESADEVVDRAVGRGGDQTAIGGEEVDVEVFERDLGQVFEVGR